MLFRSWRQFSIDDALKMIDESFQWRKEYGVNGRSDSARFNSQIVKW